MSYRNVSGTFITEFLIGGFDTLERPQAVGVVLLILYILVLIANLANIYFIVMEKSLHQPMFLFICNLAVVDILHCTSSCPTMIGVLLAGYKSISYIPCILQMFFFHVGSVMESFAICVMALDRFIAIGNPLRYHAILTNLHCVLITVMLWLVACVILTVLPVTILPLPLCHSTLKYIFCDYASVIRASCVDPNPYFNGLSILSIMWIFGSFVLICFSYLKIVIVVMKMSSVSDRKKVFNTCLSHFIVIICHYAPTLIIIVLTRIGVVLTLEERHGLMIGSIIGPSLVNPFIYCLRTKEIRHKILKILSKVEPALETRN